MRAVWVTVSLRCSTSRAGCLSRCPQMESAMTGQGGGSQVTNPFHSTLHTKVCGNVNQNGPNLHILNTHLNACCFESIVTLCVNLADIHF